MRREDLLLSCWIIEAARSSVLTELGHTDAGARGAERSRILAAECNRRGVGLAPRLASDHATWMAGVAGAARETGPLGWFFLQRLGMYVDGHVAPELDPGTHGRFVALGAGDSEPAASLAFDPEALKDSAEWPACPPAVAPGSVRAKFGIIGDPHIGLEVSNRLVPAALADLNREGVDFSVAIGDLTQNGAQAFFEQARTIFEASTSPVVVTLGNHDMWGGRGEQETSGAGTEEAVGYAHFEAVFARLPYGVHESNGVRVIVLDSSDPAPSPFPPFDLLGGGFTSQPNESVPGGRLSEEVRDWMSGLGPAGPTFVLLHHPPHPYTGFPPIIFGLDEDATGALVDLARRTGALAIFCGHTHRSALGGLGGVPVIEVPSAKEWPFGYGVVEVTEKAWSFNLRPITASSMRDAGAAGVGGVAAARRYHGGAPEAANPPNQTAGGMIFRRYARGPDEARALVRPLRPGG